MTDQEELALLEQLEREIRASAEAAYEELTQRVINGEPPQKVLNEINERVIGEHKEAFAAALSEVLERSVGSKEAGNWPIGDITLSERLHANATATALTTAEVIRQHVAAFDQAKTLAMQLYEGYDFNPTELLNPARPSKVLPKYLKRAMKDPGVRSSIVRTLSRIQASTLRTPALRAAYLQAIDDAARGAGAERLKKQLWVAYQEKMRYVANRIATTELHSAYETKKAEGIMADEQLKWVQVRMSAYHPKTDLCDYFSSVNSYGKGPGVYPKGKAPKPTYHPFCFPGDQTITSFGKIRAITRRWYDGDVVIITTSSGHDLTATPNHPILTTRGWIAIGELKEGDYVINGRVRQSVGSCNVEHQDVPTMFSEIADALGSSFEVSAAKVPASAEYFHGDGEGGEIAIVHTDLCLRSDRNSSICQRIINGALVFAHNTASRLFTCLVNHFFFRTLSSTECIMGALGERLALFFRKFRHPNKVCFTSVPLADSVIFKNSAYQAPGDTVLEGNSLARHSSDVILDHITGLGPDDSIALSTYARDMSVDVLRKVRRTRYVGHVYNLETEEGFFAVSGIISHNCRCVIVQRFDLDQEDETKRNAAAESSYLQSLDDKVSARIQRELARAHDSKNPYRVRTLSDVIT
jgi:hypothetical protein